MYRCAEATHKKTSKKLASMRLGSLNGVLIPALDFASAFVAYVAVRFVSMGYIGWH